MNPSQRKRLLYLCAQRSEKLHLNWALLINLSLLKNSVGHAHNLSHSVLTEKQKNHLSMNKSRILSFFYRTV